MQHSRQTSLQFWQATASGPGEDSNLVAGAGAGLCCRSALYLNVCLRAKNHLQLSHPALSTTGPASPDDFLPHAGPLAEQPSACPSLWPSRPCKLVANSFLTSNVVALCLLLLLPL